MKVIRLSQTEDREAWLEGRVTVITGSKAKKTKPLSRGLDRRPEGYWELLAENLAVEPEIKETDMERGHRLENIALGLTEQLYSIKLDLDPGYWISDFSDKIACSPDAAEPGDKPTYAAEAKCLKSKNHLKYLSLAKEGIEEGRFGLELVPAEFQDQILHYFVVNELLERLYFTLYDELVIKDHLMHYVVIVERKDIERRIEEQKYIHLDTVNQVKNQVNKLLKG